MQDLMISVVDAWEQPPIQSNFIVFKSDQPAVPMQEGGEYFQKCKRYAREQEAYVVTGLMNIADFLCVCMFGPNGKLAGAQRALFYEQNNRELYKKSSNLAVFPTPYGKVFLCVDADIYSPEVQRYARLAGAEIVVCSQWIPADRYNEARIWTGAWGAAQTNNFLTIAANNNGAAICAPYLTSMDNTGYLSKPGQTASTIFNVSRLMEIHSDYFSSQFNRKLFAAHRDLL